MEKTKEKLSGAQWDFIETLRQHGSLLISGVNKNTFVSLEKRGVVKVKNGKISFAGKWK